MSLLSAILFIRRKERFVWPLALLLITGCQKDEPVVQELQPVFDVETGNSEIPYIRVDTEGGMILNEPKIPAEMVIYEKKKEIQRTRIGIEYRGSTSFRLSDKKSFGIETWDEEGSDTDVTFFGFPEEEDWILSGHIYSHEKDLLFDPTLMYNFFAYRLYRNMGRYASRSKFVELEINGEYQGVYVFMEKLKRDKNRIDISRLITTDSDPEAITGGYILKIDKTAGGDHTYNQPLEYFESNWDDDARYTAHISFRSNYDINGDSILFEPYGPPYHPNQYLETYFLYEYPKAEAITDQQKAYIQKYIHEFEMSLLRDDFAGESRNYLAYIDLSSFVDYFILNELCKNIDGYRLSTYLVKDREGKLRMGPPWDFDIGYFSNDRVPSDDWVIRYNQYVSRDPWMMVFWWPRLMEDPQFRAAVKTRWLELRSGTLKTIELTGLVDNTAAYLRENGAVERNNTRWEIASLVNFDSSIENLKDFLEQRAAWMDEKITKF
jgi:hypothetical protein